MIEAGVGVSTVKDASTAGKEAVEKALRHLGKPAHLLLTFASPAYHQKELLQSMIAVTKKTPLLGGTTAGEISTWGVSDDSVVVMALHTNLPFATALQTNIKKNEFAAGKQLAHTLLRKISSRKTPQTLFVFPDGLAGNLEQLIAGIRSIIPHCIIIGGALADKTDFKRTFQYYNTHSVTNAVSALLLSNTVTASGSASGWESIGNRMKVTKSKSLSLFEFDAMPALRLYHDVLGTERAEKLPLTAHEYPLGLVDEKETSLFRAPLAINQQQQSLLFATPFHEGKEVTIATASRNALIESAARAAEQAKRQLKKARPSFMLVFNALGEKLVLGGRTQEVINALQNTLGRDIPLAGFFTYGEISSSPSKPSSFTNQTTLVCVIGEKA